MALMHPPEEVLEIASKLRRAGFQAWCVGGAVRDALLGHAHLDWDLATDARPEDVMRTFKRTVPVGLAFGTVGVLDRNGRLHEVTTFRHDVKTDGRHAEVEFGASLEEDLARRDFTVNAIAYDPHTGELCDPFHGRKDLRAKVLRAVGEPDERMKEDRLRALRALRFASRFGFEIDPATWAAIIRSGPHLTRLSFERVKQELEKTMEQVATPSVALARWRECGAFEALIPALHAVPSERFAVCDCLPRPSLAGRPSRKLLRLAALFFGDDARVVEKELKRLKFSNLDAAWIGKLCAAEQGIGARAEALVSGPVPDAELRRWAALAGRTVAGPWFRLKAAQWSSRRTSDTAAPESQAARSTYRRLVKIAYRDPIEVGDLQVDGEDLAMAGIPKGPALGTTLKRLLEWVVEDPARNTRDQLLAHAQSNN